MVDVFVVPGPSVGPGEHVRHPRLGLGRVLRAEPDGSVIVRFMNKKKPDRIMPLALEPWGPTEPVLPQGPEKE